MDGNEKRISYFIYATISSCQRERRKINNNMDRQGGGSKKGRNMACRKEESENLFDMIRFDSRLFIHIYIMINI